MAPPSMPASSATATGVGVERALVQLRALAGTAEGHADVAAAACGPGDADLERVLSEAHADLDAGGVVEGAQQVLDDPVGRQLDARGEHARAALDDKARGVALIAQDERPQRGQR